VPRNVSDDDAPSTSAGSQAYPSASDYYIAADEITASSSSSSSSSSTDQYEIEQHGSAVFGNRADLLRDDSPESQGDPWNNVGTVESLEDKFSKSSQEREKLLQRRKEQMLITARKR
jgi:E3 ubiquitin-protein ligase AMFR